MQPNIIPLLAINGKDMHKTMQNKYSSSVFMHAILCLLLVFLSPYTKAQKVGVVLSGGGAKGLAHIAVLKVLEDNGIPIDYIAGTSIGAIVGGLYAAGYSPEQIEKLFKSEDFYYWSTGKIQPQYRYYFKRPEDEPTWIQLKLTKEKDKFRLLPPTNFIPPEQMDFAFMELTAAASAACEYDFNQLMIPFFCVATDVNNSRAVVLRNGDLGNSIRASMTVPFYFRPIVINGALMFDGGLLNNFPADLMKEIFHPDIIIGHNVADVQKEASPDDLLRQITNIVMRPTNYSIPPEDGILLKTRLEDVDLLDFNKADEIMARGMETALNAIDSIKARIPRRLPPEKAAIRRAIFNAQKPELKFQHVQVEGIKDNMQRRFIIQSIKHGQDIISLDELKKEYFKLVADQHLKSIQPLTYYNKQTKRFDLHLRAEPEKKMNVHIGGNISTQPINQGYLGLHYRTYNQRAYSLLSNIYFGRFYSSLKVGGRIDYPTRLPFYLASYLTLNRWDYFSSGSQVFFEDVQPPYIIRDELNFKFESGFPLGIHTKFYANATYTSETDDYYQSDTYKKNDSPDQTRFNAFVLSTAIENNSLNYKQFATEGTHQSVEIKYINGTESHHPGTTSLLTGNYEAQQTFWQLQAHSAHYFKLNRFITLGTHAEVSWSDKDLFRTYKSERLFAPAFSPTPHSKTLFIDHFRSTNYAAGGLKGLFHFTPDLHLRLELYEFAPFREIVADPNRAPFQQGKFLQHNYWMWSASLVQHTSIGPLSLSLNAYDKTGTQYYLTLNFGYVLFNKKGI